MAPKKLMSAIRRCRAVVSACVLLALSVPSAAFALGATAAALPSGTPALRVKAPMKARRASRSGWVKKGEDWCNYTNGVAAKGWKRIGGRTYDSGYNGRTAR